MGWNSRYRVYGCMYGGITCGGATWVSCYLLWLNQGCDPWLPFVSDFGGGETTYLFGVGMTLAALLLIPTWFDYYKVTRPEPGAHRYWHYMHRAVPYMGVWCSLSICGVALNPWDIRLITHVVAANGIFVGGVTFSWIATALSHHRGKHSYLALVNALSCAFGMVLMGTCFYAGLSEISQGSHTIDITFLRRKAAMMESDYIGYCEQKLGSFHRSPLINMAAFWEWVMLGSLTMQAFVLLRLELCSWPADELADVGKQPLLS